METTLQANPLWADNQAKNLDQRVDRVLTLIAVLENVLEQIETKGPRGGGILLMLRNKFGLKKKEAEKLYYDYRASGEKEGGENNPDSPEPDDNASLEDKVSHIMSTMKETAEKIDRIERDIDYLKDQVDQILKKL